MKIKLPVTWSVCGMIEVEADSISDAMEYFNEHSEHVRLPSECEYVDGSFELSSGEEQFIFLYQTKRTKLRLLTHSMTFIEACVKNLCVPTDIDDFVEFWHAEAAAGRELREAIGMDAEQYAQWLREGNAYVSRLVKERAATGGA